MTNYFIVPGLGNSGPEHWQTYFENSGDNFIRINQKDWDTPDCSEWVGNINAVVSSHAPETIVLIGHSSGCPAIVFWAKKFGKKIKGAMLVGPTDTEASQYSTFTTTGFFPLPTEKINFKTILVASTNDPWVSAERAQYFADCWGSELINVGDAGHINAASGHGIWEEGLEILKRLG